MKPRPTSLYHRFSLVATFLPADRYSVSFHPSLAFFTVTYRESSRPGKWAASGKPSQSDDIAGLVFKPAESMIQRPHLFGHGEWCLEDGNGGTGGIGYLRRFRQYGRLDGGGKPPSINCTVRSYPGTTLPFDPAFLGMLALNVFLFSFLASSHKYSGYSEPKNNLGTHWPARVCCITMIVSVR